MKYKQLNNSYFYKKSETLTKRHVFNENEDNVALPKSQFAEYVLTQNESFNDFDVSEFEKIFSLFFALFQLNRETESHKLPDGRVIRLGEQEKKGSSDSTGRVSGCRLGQQTH